VHKTYTQILAHFGDAYNLEKVDLFGLACGVLLDNGVHPPRIDFHSFFKKG
jgi:hypothetical protein